jgi:hypothetical protein
VTSVATRAGTDIAKTGAGATEGIAVTMAIAGIVATGVATAEIAVTTGIVAIVGVVTD